MPAGAEAFSCGGYDWAAARMEAAERSASAAVVRQLVTETRTAGRSSQLVPESQQTLPSRTRCASVRVRPSPSAPRTRNSTWFRWTSLRISISGPSASRAAMRDAWALHGLDHPGHPGAAQGTETGVDGEPAGPPRELGPAAR